MARKKIAIIGTSPSKNLAPINDPGWDIWICNIGGYNHFKKWNRIFEIHRRWEESDKEYLEDLKKIGPPQQVVSIIPLGGPANVVLDRDKLFKKYGAIWFSSSLAYMLGCALEENPTDIGIWGVDMESHEEYVVQFAGCRHFLDLARYVGIKIHIPDRCLLLREPTAYPDRFETIQALTYEQKAVRIKNLIKNAEQKLEKVKLQSYSYVGRVATLQEFNENGQYDKAIEEAADEGQIFVSNLEEWKLHLANLKGELWATQQYKRLFVWNVLPPDSDEVTNAEIEDCGPT
mgnify:CR=1 FL=1